jgi:hypothetical protein
MVGQYIGGGRIAVSSPASSLATRTDQVAADAVAFGERVRRLSAQELLATCGLSSTGYVQCFAMGFLLESPVQLADSQVLHLSTPRGALQ